MLITLLLQLILFQLFTFPCLSQLITYLSCTTNSDCLHHGLSLCVTGKCEPCVSNSDCSHLDQNSNCLTNDLTTYCQVPCDNSKGADICAKTNSLCHNDGISSYCNSCASQADCATQYPTGVQCLAINGIGYCGYCMIDSQCPTSHICKNLRCVQCSANSDCPSERPFCSSTLKASTCMCRDNNDCSSSRPTCIKKTSNDPSTCYLLPTLQVTHGDSPEKVILKFNKPMAPASDITDILSIKLVNVDENLYSYAIEEIDSQIYELIFKCNMDIAAPSLSIEIIRPKQLPDNEGLVLDKTTYLLSLPNLDLLPKNHQESIPIAEEITRIGTIVLLAASAAIALLSADTVTFWMLINFLQNHYFLLYIKASYLPNITEPLTNFGIANFTFVPNVITILFEYLGQDMNNIKRNLTDESIDSITFLFRIGHIVTVWAIVLACAVVLIVITKLFKLYKGTSFVKKLKDILVWSGVLRVLFACYQELTYASFMQVQELSFDTTLLGISSLLGLAGAIAGAVIPILVMPSLRKHSKTSARNYTKGLGMIVHEYNTDIFTGRFYLTLSLLRRLITSLILIFLTSYPIITIIIILGFNILAIILLTYKPFKASRHNNLCKVMEGISIFSNVLVLSLLLDLYGGEPDGEIRIWTCWEMVASVFLTLFSGFLFVVYEALQALVQLQKRRTQPPQTLKAIHRPNRGENLRSIIPYTENDRLNRSDIPLEYLNSSSILTLSHAPSIEVNSSQITFRGSSLHRNEGTKEGFVPLGSGKNASKGIKNYSRGSSDYLQAPQPLYLQPPSSTRPIRKRSSPEDSTIDLDVSLKQKSSPRSPGVQPRSNVYK